MGIKTAKTTAIVWFKKKDLEIAVTFKEGLTRESFYEMIYKIYSRKDVDITVFKPGEYIPISLIVNFDQFTKEYLEPKE
jgi:hypothetical protein